MKAIVKWIGGLEFVSESGSGHALVMDAPLVSGGRNLAPSPMEVVLSALGACSGMDVVSILEKMREDLSQFSIEINAERKEDHPRVFSKVEMVYKFRGKGLNSENIEKAVKLSFEKYCSVGRMLKLACPITYRIEIGT